MSEEGAIYIGIPSGLLTQSQLWIHSKKDNLLVLLIVN